MLMTSLIPVHSDVCVDVCSGGAEHRPSQRHCTAAQLHRQRSVDYVVQHFHIIFILKNWAILIEDAILNVELFWFRSENIWIKNQVAYAVYKTV